MLNKIKLLIATSRPISWVNTAYPFAAGYLLMGGNLDASFVIGTLFFLIPYNLVMYGINDVFDYESDIRNPRKGGVEGAVTARQHHPLIVWSSILLSLPFIVYLLVAGTVISGLTLLAVMFFVIAYSAKGLRFKEVPFLDSMTSSAHFVGPLIYAYSLVGTSSSAWVAAAAFFAWGVASQSFGAVQDIVPDREGGIRSIATVLGARRTVFFSFIMYALAVVFAASLSGWAVIIAVAGCAYLINVAPFLSNNDEHSYLARAGWKRFLWLNYVVGAVITVTLILATI